MYPVRPRPASNPLSGPAGYEAKAKPQQFCGFHESGEVSSGLDNGLISGSLSRMFVGVNHGPVDLKGERQPPPPSTYQSRSGPRLPRHLVAWPRDVVDRTPPPSSNLNSPRSLNWGFWP